MPIEPQQVRALRTGPGPIGKTRVYLPDGELSSSNPMPAQLYAQSSAQGDLHVSQLTPFIQTRATKGARPANFREFSASGGSVSYVDREFCTNCTSTLGSYGVLRSLRSLNFKAGFGASIRFKARFGEPVALTQQGVGGFNIGDEFSFGYNGTEFGIFHRYGGLAEVQRLTITTPASGAETATLTLDGTAYNIPITNAAAEVNAKEVADWMMANQSVVNARQNEDTVTFFWLSDGPKTGTMSFSSTGAAVGSMTEVKNGVTKQTDHTPQGSWNGTFHPEFDPTKYNAYHIEYEGNANFYIEDPESSSYIRCHSIQYLNSETQVRLGDPALHLGLYTYNVGGSSGVSTYVAGISGFVDGVPRPIRNPRGAENTKNIASGAEYAILTIRNVEVINGVPNQVEIEPIYLSLSNEGNKTATFRVRGNATLGGNPNFVYENEDNLVSEIDTTATTAGGGLLIAAFKVAPGESKEVDLSPFRVRIPPTIAYTVSAEYASGSAADAGVGLTWYEDE